MSLQTVYYPGGFQANAPQHNKASEMDSVAGTLTAWDPQGNQTLQRALTTQELAALAAQDAADTAIANASTIRGKVAAALTANETYIALGSPSAAQTTVQVQRLSREMNALLRFVFSQLQDISDT